MERFACWVLYVALFAVVQGGVVQETDALADDTAFGAIPKPFDGRFRGNFRRKILNRFGDRTRVTQPQGDAEDDSEQVEDPEESRPEPIPHNRQKLLRVVDPEGAPIAGATVNLFSVKGTSQTDENGELVIDATRGLTGTIRAEGFVPFSLNSTHDDAARKTPTSKVVTVRMTRGVRIDGMIRDDQGRPLEDISVGLRFHATILSDKVYRAPILADAKTDARGRWSCSMAPEGGEVSVQVMIGIYSIYRSTWQPVESLACNVPREKKVITLPVGRRVTGRVLDPDGATVPNADVFLRHGLSSARVKTDDSGAFQFSYCAGDRFMLSAWAPSFAPVALEVCDKSIDRVELRLSVGRPMQVRVVDQDGEPLSGVRMDFLNWIPYGAYFVNPGFSDTDDDGISVWESAPTTGTLLIRLRKADYHTISAEDVLAGSEETQTLTMYGEWTASGRVVDAQTNEPIPSFHAKLGDKSLRYKTDETMEHIQSATGEYSVSAERKFFREGVLRIEAEGYQPFATDMLQRADGDVSCDLELRKAKTIGGAVLQPDGKPAVGAEVLIVAPNSTIYRTIEGITSIRGNLGFPLSFRVKTQTDAQGRFRVPEEVPPPYELLISHDEGCAIVAPESIGEPEPIRLEPWSRIEGVISLNGELRPEERVETVSFHDDHTTKLRFFHESDAQGRFVVERVFPGCYKTCRLPQRSLDRGATRRLWTHGQTIQCEAGKTTKIVLGGTGIDVRGTIQRQPVDIKPDPDVPPIVKLLPIPAVVPWPDELKDLPSDDETKLRWLWDWREKPDDIDFGGSDPEVAYRFYRTWAEKDGSYLLKCVPPGEYVMTVWQTHFDLTTGRNGEFIAMEDKVVVPSDGTSGGTFVVNMNSLGAEVVEYDASGPTSIRRTRRTGLIRRPIRSWIRKNSACPGFALDANLQSP